jgi:hypothetical protein
MYTALRATSKTIVKYLENQFKADTILSHDFDGGSMIVSLSTPQEMVKQTAEGLSVWLYRIIRDEQSLNRPPTRVSPNELLPPPLPMRLYYLITPITNKKVGSPETEQLILGKVLQVFHSRPILRGADLEAEFTGTEVKLHLRLEPLTLEEITRVWEALEESYQLSVSYEVSVVHIDTALEPERVTPVEVVLPEYGVIVNSEPS